MSEIDATDYLDQEFPKGKNKYRGAAMCLMAFVKMEAKQEAYREVEEKIVLMTEYKLRDQGNREMDGLIFKDDILDLLGEYK